MTHEKSSDCKLNLFFELALMIASRQLSKVAMMQHNFIYLSRAALLRNESQVTSLGSLLCRKII